MTTANPQPSGSRTATSIASPDPLGAIQQTSIGRDSIAPWKAETRRRIAAIYAEECIKDSHRNVVSAREMYAAQFLFYLPMIQDCDYFLTISTNRTKVNPEHFESELKELMWRFEKELLGKTAYTRPPDVGLKCLMVIEEGTGALHGHAILQLPTIPLTFNWFKSPLRLEERVIVPAKNGPARTKYRKVSNRDDVDTLEWRSVGSVASAEEERRIFLSRNQHQHGKTWRLIQPYLNRRLTLVATAMNTFKHGNVMAYQLRSAFANGFRFNDRRVHQLGYVLKECCLSGFRSPIIVGNFACD